MCGPVMKAHAQEQYVRLEHPTGKAQIDFGNFKIIDADAIPIYVSPFEGGYA